MPKNEQTTQSRAAEYGHALLSNRGGWTLREVIGNDYEKFSGSVDARLTQQDFQESLERVSSRIYHAAKSHSGKPLDQPKK